MMQCTRCGADVSEHARFCARCGEAVAVFRPAVGPAAANSSASAPTLPREELHAAVAARRELGERMEPEVIDAFLSRVEGAVTARIDTQVAERLRTLPRVRRGRDGSALPLAICSLIFGIPLTAIAGDVAELPGLICVWAGIAAVNLAYNMREKSR